MYYSYCLCVWAHCCAPLLQDGVKAAKRSIQIEIQTAVHKIYQQLSVTLEWALQANKHHIGNKNSHCVPLDNPPLWILAKDQSSTFSSFTSIQKPNSASCWWRCSHSVFATSRWTSPLPSQAVCSAFCPSCAGQRPCWASRSSCFTSRACPSWVQPWRWRPRACCRSWPLAQGKGSLAAFVQHDEVTVPANNSAVWNCRTYADKLSAKVVQSLLDLLCSQLKNLLSQAGVSLLSSGSNHDNAKQDDGSDSEKKDFRGEEWRRPVSFCCSVKRIKNSTILDFVIQISLCSHTPWIIK